MPESVKNRNDSHNNPRFNVEPKDARIPSQHEFIVNREDKY